MFAFVSDFYLLSGSWIVYLHTSLNQFSKRDFGLQSERTTLAWQRTILLFGLNILFLFRDAVVSKTMHSVIAVYFGVIIFSLSLVVYFCRKNDLSKSLSATRDGLVASVVFASVLALLGIASAILIFAKAII